MIKGFPQHLKLLFGRDFSCLSNITKKLPDTEIKALVFVKFSGRYRKFYFWFRLELFVNI
jgi:hypothetical protein